MKLGINYRKVKESIAENHSELVEGAKTSLGNTFKAAAVLAALAPAYSMADSPALLAALDSHDRVEIHQSSEIDFNRSIKGALTRDYPATKGTSIGFVKDLVMHKMNIECMPDPSVLQQIEAEGKTLVSCTTDAFRTSSNVIRVDVVTTDSDLSKNRLESSLVAPSLKDNFFLQRDYLLKKLGMPTDPARANTPTIYQITHVPAGFASSLYKDNSYSAAIDLGRAAMDFNGKKNLSAKDVVSFLQQEGYIQRFNARGENLSQKIDLLKSLGVLEGLSHEGIVETKTLLENPKGLIEFNKRQHERFMSLHELTLNRYQDGLNDVTLKAAGMKPCDLTPPSFLKGGQAELNTRCLAESGTSIGAYTAHILSGKLTPESTDTINGKLFSAVAVGTYDDHPVIFHTDTSAVGSNMFVLKPDWDQVPKMNAVLGGEKELAATKAGAINITHDFLSTIGAQKMTAPERKAVMEVFLNHEIKHLRDAHEYAHTKSGALMHDYETVQQLDCDVFGAQEFFKKNPSINDAKELKSGLIKAAEFSDSRGDYTSIDFSKRLTSLAEYTQLYIDGKLSFDKEGVLKKVEGPAVEDHSGHKHHAGHNHGQKPKSMGGPGF